MSRKRACCTRWLNRCSPATGQSCESSWRDTDGACDGPKILDERISAISDPRDNPIAFIHASRRRTDGTELLQTVRRSLEILPKDGIVEIVARNRPGRVIGNLAAAGYRVRTSTREDGTWQIEVSSGNAPEIVDLRDLEAPEPMRRVLLAAAALEQGALYLVRLPHVPHPLFPLLDEKNLCWWVHEEKDHSALLAIRRPGQP